MPGKASIPGRGRKARPNAQKQLTRSKHINKNAVEFDLITNAEPPIWLAPLAVEMWGKVCPHLCEQKILTVTDLHNLEAFCNSYATWREAAEHLRLNGSVVEGATGGPIKNPAATVVNESLRQMLMFGANLGLDPASHGRLSGVKPGNDSNPFSDF